uniref:G_PROTEIN_RECEP_F1_2 domain-containing protein n=1 Tax=Caenorhabditis tropicalis TaxID=1561998 RepID=A0A1I7SYC7_9PELO
MIIVHTPYRKYTMSLLKIETRLRNNNILAVQVIKSPTNILVISMAILFETRLLTFTVRDHWWRKYRVPWFALNFISACFWPLPIYLDVPEQKYAKELIMKEFPCKPDYTDFELVFVFTIDNTIPGLACLVMLCILCPQILIYAIGTGRLLSQQMKMSISKNTIKMQMNFQKALYLQVKSSMNQSYLTNCRWQSQL